MRQIVAAMLAISSILTAVDVVRVPDNKRVPSDEPPPPPPKREKQQEGVDFPSLWDWEQVIARTNANYRYNGTNAMDDQWWFQTVQPFYSTSETRMNTLFFQFRSMFEGSIKTFNSGLGYRLLCCDDNYLFGLNGFFDTRYRHQLQRWSIGADFQTPWLALWGSYYGGLLGWRHVGTAAGTITWRRALSGGEVNASAPFPYLPWFRLQAGFYTWNYVDGVKNANGYRIAGKMNIWGPLAIEGGRWSDRYINDNFVQVSLNFGFPNFMQYTLVNTGIADTVLPARTLKRFILNPIRRWNQIRIQTKTSSNGVIIGRS